MGFLSPLYHEYIWRPLFNGLFFLYAMLPGNDFGVAIVVFTIILRIILLPLHWKARMAQQSLASLQPEVKRIQEKYKNDREGQGRALMELYAEKKVNPFSGCLPLLIQFPILIALFQIFRSGLDPTFLIHLYSFLPHSISINPIAFGFLDLSKGNIILGFFAALSQFLQMKVSTPPPPTGGKDDFSAIFQKQSLYLFPFLVLMWSNWLPAAITLYWTVLNIFGIVQDTILSRIAKKRTLSAADTSYGNSNTNK
jgi:YidC/Oxa1 family membrane protein insertase